MAKRRKTGEPELIRLTPDLAAEWLRKSENPRPIDPGRVATYAKDMRDGNWTLTHQGMALNEYGLRDGFHRCSAVVESGVSILVWVFWDVDENAVIEMDGGKTRSAAVALRAAGFPVSSKEIAIVTGMMTFPRNWSALSRSEIGDNITKYRTALDFVGEHCRSANFPVPVKCAIARALYHAEDTDLLAHFCAAVRGEPDNSTGLDFSAALKLLSALNKIQGGGRGPRLERYCLAQAAILRFLKQEKIRHLYPIYEDRFPLPE